MHSLQFHIHTLQLIHVEIDISGFFANDNVSFFYLTTSKKIVKIKFGEQFAVIVLVPLSAVAVTNLGQKCWCVSLPRNREQRSFHSPREDGGGGGSLRLVVCTVGYNDFNNLVTLTL
jgi:hypothetical protein